MEITLKFCAAGLYIRVFTWDAFLLYIDDIASNERSESMYTTKAFKNGNSQAIRIPSDLAYERTDIELEIERQGDEIRIRPARRTLANVLNKFARFSPDFMSEGRGEHEQAERDSL